MGGEEDHTGKEEAKEEGGQGDVVFVNLNYEWSVGFLVPYEIWWLWGYCVEGSTGINSVEG